MEKIYPLEFNRIDILPSPNELKEEYPSSFLQMDFVKQKRKEIQDILDGKDSRILLIVGPCSIHDMQAAEEFALKLKQLSKEVAEVFLVVMRVHFEKPRTSLGWKGLLYDPFLNGSHDIKTGLQWIRKLLLDLINIEVPAATEFLDPLSHHFYGDLISWGCIGARTVSSQIHRQIASYLEMPICFKNSLDGNIETAINGIITASIPHSFIGLSPTGSAAIIHSQGNPYGHITLRGSRSGSNYDPHSIASTLNLLEKAGLPQRLLIDCSHDNSQRQHLQQCIVFESIINQIVHGNKNIRGAILESHLFAGNQELQTTPQKLKYAISLTDPCLDWNSTEELIRWGFKILKNAKQLNEQGIYQTLEEPATL